MNDKRSSKIRQATQPSSPRHPPPKAATDRRIEDLRADIVQRFRALDTRINELFGFLEAVKSDLGRQVALGFQDQARDSSMARPSSIAPDTAPSSLALPSSANFRDGAPVPDISDRAIFVVAHARSGTTILSETLNSSPEVYCLNEANWHQNISRGDFASWYNRMHRNFANPLSRNTYVPEVAGNGWAVLSHIGSQFKYVGDKLAYRHQNLGYDYFGFYAFAARFFSRSKYLCLFREPFAVARSSIRLFSQSEFSESNLNEVATSQLQSYHLMLSLYFTLPNVFFISHEGIGAQTFKRLSSILELDLNGAECHYDLAMQGASREPDITEVSQSPALIRVREYHSRLAKCIDGTTLLPRKVEDIKALFLDLHADLLNTKQLPPGWS